MSHQKYVKDGVIDLPDIVYDNDMQNIPGAFKEHFRRDDRYPDRWVLTDKGKAVKAWARQEVENIRSERAAKEAENTETLAKLNNKITELSVTTAVRSALASEGVAAHYLSAACALVQQSNAWEVDTDDPDAPVLAKTDFGLYSALDVVNAFLDSDEGKVFKAAKHVAAADGMFTAMLANMRR